MVGFRQINYAISVAREGSFTLASKHLNISQSAISEQVRLLEDSLGFPVFVRTGRGVRPTSKGQIYLHEAEKLLSSLHKLDDLARSLGKSRQDLIRVGLISGIAERVIPKLHEFVRVKNPPQFNLTTTTTRKIYSGLMANDLDIGFAIQSRSDLVPSGLDDMPIFSTDMVLIGAEGAPIASDGERVDLGSVSRSPFVVGELSIGYGLATINAFGILLERELNIVSIVDNVETMKSMVRLGVGLALVPDSSILSTDRNSGLRIYRLTNPPKVTISAYYLRTNAHRFDLSLISEFATSAEAR